MKRTMIELDTKERLIEEVTHEDMSQWLADQNFEIEEYKTAEREQVESEIVEL